MSNLRTLKPALWELSKQQQLLLHEEIRVSRKVSKLAPKKKAVARNKQETKINKSISNLTPAQAQAILAELQAQGRI